MEIHLYTLCWNEADILPFFFRHYDPWVDRYIIYDDGSTDGSLEILKEHPKVDVRNWQRKYPDSFIHSQEVWLSEVWKESRGKADWVILVDMDEHLIVPKTPMLELLKRYKDEGVTIVPALGFEMLSEEFPDSKECLAVTRTRGKYSYPMCKSSIIDPNRIENLSFPPGGRHLARVVGRKKYPLRDELLLLHYKTLGFDRTHKKENALYANLGSFDISRGRGLRLAAGYEKMCDIWKERLKLSENYVWDEFEPKNYPNSNRWWRPFYQWMAHAGRFIRDPVKMLQRLKYHIYERMLLRRLRRFDKIITEINKTPVKKRMYELVTKGPTSENPETTITISNGINEKGMIVHCLYSSNVKEIPGLEKIQSIIRSIKGQKDQSQDKCETYIISNCQSFAPQAVSFAKQNNINLIAREEMIDFIANINET